MATITPAAPAHSQADNIRGSLYMMAAMGGFAVNDMIVKSLAMSLNLGQTVFLRGCFATAGVFLLALYMGQMRNPLILFRPAVIIRSLGEAGATLAFVYALFNMPIANVTAIYQVLPLVLTLAAALILGEQVGWRRIAAIFVGFIGVLIIIRPGFEGFSIYSIVVLLSVAASVVRDLYTRTIPREIPGLMITLATAFFVTLSGLAMSFFQEWKPVTTREISLFAATSIFLVTGYYFIVASTRTGEIGFVAPFRYTMLLFAIIGGIVFYDEIPDGWTLAGAALVAGSGIYALYRERVVHRQKITPPPVRS